MRSQRLTLNQAGAVAFSAKVIYAKTKMLEEEIWPDEQGNDYVILREGTEMGKDKWASWGIPLSVARTTLDLAL
ncbi:MAG: hypothetical protein ACYS7Y_30010 [Planctomycetota bacterium]|jgi:hypothetical protein